MQRLLLDKARFERNVLGTLLPAIAGAVNASGFFALGTYTSHMTGIVSRAGDELSQRHFWLATRALLFLGSFMFGAAVATALVAIEVTKLLDRWRTVSQARPLLARLRALLAMSGDGEAHHLRLHLRVLGCFFGGATIGPSLYLVIGHWAILIPVAFLLLLAIFDARFGLGSTADAASLPALRGTPAPR